MGILNWGEPDNKPKMEIIKQVQPQTPPPPKFTDFMLKYKYSYRYSGTDCFYLVDNEGNLYRMRDDVEYNIYTWKIAGIGDTIRILYEFPAKDGRIIKRTKYEVIKKGEGVID